MQDFSKKIELNQQKMVSWLMFPEYIYFPNAGFLDIFLNGSCCPIHLSAIIMQILLASAMANSFYNTIKVFGTFLIFSEFCMPLLYAICQRWLKLFSTLIRTLIQFVCIWPQKCSWHEYQSSNWQGTKSNIAFLRHESFTLLAFIPSAR